MRHGGYTLFELILVLTLLAILLAVAVPRAGRWRDGLAVRSAREDVAAALAWTRLAAAARGGAALHLDPVDDAIWTSYGDGSTTPRVSLAGRYGVALDPGASGAIAVRYDLLGIGRVASRTVRITRGSAVAGVTVSAYGRFRRW